MPSVLEEGLAVEFTSQCFRHYLNIHMFDPHITSYKDAWYLVKELLAIDGDAVTTMRNQQSTVSLISADLIKRIVPTLKPETADRLASPFKR